MTIEEILEEFKDINYAYNNASKYDTLKRMLEELEDQAQQSCLDKIVDDIEDIAFHDANGVLYCGFTRVRKIIEKYKGGCGNGK